MPKLDDSANNAVKAEEVTELTLEELCKAYDVNRDFVIELISFGTVEPVGFSIETWRFNNQQLHVVRTAVRLYHDLEVNHAGIALAIDLLSEIDELRSKLERLEKYSSVLDKE
ncbi:MAG: chaperone modulator CbpM [Gammaproteobacteria bacterium]